MKAEKEAKEVKAEEEENDAQGEHVTDPDAGASDPTAVPRSVARNGQDAQIPPIVVRASRRTRATAPQAGQGVLPGIVDADGDAAATLLAPPRRRPRRVVYSRVVVVGGALRLRATVDADAARNLRAALALSPQPFAAADAADGRPERARPRRTTPTPRRRRACDDDQRASPSFLRVDDDAENERARPDARDDRSRSRASAAGAVTRARWAPVGKSPRFARRAAECSSSTSRSLDAASAALETRASRTFDSTSRLAARLHAKRGSADASPLRLRPLAVGARDGRRRESRERCERRDVVDASADDVRRTHASSDARGEDPNRTRDDRCRGGGRGRHPKTPKRLRERH